MSNYSTNSDMLRLVFEILYVILLTLNMINFIRVLKDRNALYNRWWKSEIQSLSNFEKEQRHKKKPEWIRKLSAIIHAYTISDFIYFALSITAIIYWISFNQTGVICNEEISKKGGNLPRDFYPIF